MDGCQCSCHRWKRMCGCRNLGLHVPIILGSSSGPLDDWIDWLYCFKRQQQLQGLSDDTSSTEEIFPNNRQIWQIGTKIFFCPKTNLKLTSLATHSLPHDTLNVQLSYCDTLLSHREYEEMLGVLAMAPLIARCVKKKKKRNTWFNDAHSSSSSQKQMLLFSNVCVSWSSRA